MKFYHYTPKRNLASILARGLRPGSEVGHGEQLPVVLLDCRPYMVRTGLLMFVEVELDPSDPKLRWVNDSWIEFSGNIPPQAITAIAYPPDDNAEALRHLMRDGEDRTPWTYQPLTAQPWLTSAGVS